MVISGSKDHVISCLHEIILELNTSYGGAYMGKTYKGWFAAVFILIDCLVLLLCYHLTQAPVLYYILAAIILLSSIFYIIYKLRPGLRDFLDDHVDIPFFYALIVLLFL